MIHKFKSTCAVALLMVLAAVSVQAQQLIYPRPGGGIIGKDSSALVGFHGKPPTAQRKGVAQTALATTAATGTITIATAPTAMVLASGSLTIGILPTAGDYIVLGSGTYYFETTFSGSNNQVLISNDITDTLENLIAAINASSTGSEQNGATYYLSGSAADTSASASLITGGTSILATSIATGTAGNAVASTSSFTSGSNSWGGATLSGGVTGDTVVLNSGTYTFAASVSGTIPNLVLASGTSGSAADLIAAINVTPGLAGIEYSLPTVSSTSAIAASGTAPNIVGLTAQLSGTAANLYGLAKTGTNVTVSGTSLSGGTQFSDTNAEANLLNEIRAALVAKGLIKGSN